MRRRRIYVLNGKEIKASECDGFLHHARTYRGSCPACGKPVNKGDSYVRLNYFDTSDPYHLECFIDIYPQHCILGIRTEKRKRFGTEWKYVICRDYSRKK